MDRWIPRFRSGGWRTGLYRHLRPVPVCKDSGRKALFLCLLLGVFSLQAFSQGSPSFSGLVRDGQGNPLIGVTVQVKGKGEGTITNDKGKFSLNAQPGDSLLFTYVGYQPLGIKVGNSKSEKVTMKATQGSLHELVVVGYGMQKRADITGSVTSVPKDRIGNLPVTNVLQSVEGSVAGLTITTPSSSPGTSANVLIRGKNSISANTTPLIVVDGIPFSSLGGLTNDINPNDIASIEVLKDASAVAIYGTRGSNGVILITTKRGTTGKPTISYNGFAGPQFNVNLLRMMDGKEYVQKNLDFDQQMGIDPAPVPNFGEEANYKAGHETDWVKAVSQQGFIQDHNLNISGGTDVIKYYISGEYMKQRGTVKGYQYHRASVHSNLDATLAPWLKAGASLMYTANNYDGGHVDFLEAIKMSPYGQLYDANGGYAIYPMDPDTFFGSPFLGLNTTVINREKNLTGNFYTEVEPEFFPGFKYRLNASYSYLPTRNDSYAGREANNPMGSASIKNGETTSWLVENIFTYVHDWSQQHIDVTGLYSAQKTSIFNSSIGATGFFNDKLGFNNAGAASKQTVGSSSSDAQYLSQMLRVNYSLFDKYLFTATARRDGYSAFGAETNKYAIFPSVALGWNISDESFMKDLTAVSHLKLRASYGKSGNQAINPYTTISQLGTVQYIYNMVTTTGVVASVLGNPNLKWESTTGLNLGVDFSLLHDRLSGTVDLYRTRTKNVILTRQIPVVSGFSSILENVGQTKNKGIEITLNSVNVQTPVFSWRTTLVGASNSNKVVEIYGDNKDDVGNLLFLGHSLGAIYDYKLIGVWQTGEDASKTDPGAKPGDLKFQDTNGDGKITPDDRVYLGNTFPKFTGGLTNTFSYKHFSLDIFMQGSFGMLKDNSVMNFAGYAGRWNLYSGLGYWTETNQNNSRPALSYTNSRGYKYPMKDNYFRLKDITLNYRFDQSVLDKLGLSAASVYVSGRDIHTFSNWFGWDPEPDYSSTTLYPDVASFVLGINVSLR